MQFLKNQVTCSAVTMPAGSLYAQHSSHCAKSGRQLTQRPGMGNIHRRGDSRAKCAQEGGRFFAVGQACRAEMQGRGQGKALRAHGACHLPLRTWFPMCMCIRPYHPACIALKDSFVLWSKSQDMLHRLLDAEPYFENALSYTHICSLKALFYFDRRPLTLLRFPQAEDGSVAGVCVPCPCVCFTCDIFVSHVYFVRVQHLIHSCYLL
jgi:hypothetical protein